MILIVALEPGYVPLNFFCFQAEDGIRGPRVTGVQTCALPISGASTARPSAGKDSSNTAGRAERRRRSEERRVGKEGRSRWSPYHLKKKKKKCKTSRSSGGSTAYRTSHTSSYRV